MTPGDTATITLTLPGPVDTASEYWKYGKKPGDTLDDWYAVPFGSNDGDNIITLTITDGGLGDNDLTADGFIIDPGGIGSPRLVFTTAEQTVAAGDPSGAVTVQVQDRFGTVVTTFNGTLTLASDSPTMRFDTVATGLFDGTVSSITMTGGQGTFYFKDETLGTPTVTVSASGIAPSSQTETIVAGPAAQLVITSAAQSVPAGAVSAPVTVEARDVLGNLATSFNGTVDLASDSVTMVFDLSATGLFDGSVNTVTLSSGVGSFFFMDTTVGNPTITISATGLAPDSQLETIN